MGEKSETSRSDSNQTSSLIPSHISRLVPWILELASLVLSSVCIVSILILLLVYDDEPVPTWNGVTFNAVISILSMGAHASVLLPLSEAVSQLKWQWMTREPRPMRDYQRFDNASRGPLGSFAMLCQPRLWRYSSLGPLLIVLAIAIEPFLQQIPVYTPGLVLDSNGAASIPKSTGYADTETYRNGTASAQKLGAGSKGAIYAGLFDYGSASNTLQLNCPSGNCTWPVYTSLGVCGACQNTSLWAHDEFVFDDDNSSNTPTYISNFYNISVWEQLHMYRGTAGFYDDPSSFDYGIGSWIGLYWPSAKRPQTASDPERPDSFECTLSYCLQEFNTSMVNGELHQQVLSKFPTHTVSQYDQAVRSSVRAQNRWIVEISLPGTNDVYTVDMRTHRQLNYWVIDNLESGALGAEVDAGYLDTTGAAKSDNDAARVFYQAVLQQQHERLSGGPDAVVRRIASAMTTYMSNKDGTQVDGHAQTVAVYLHARWLWAILPVTVLALAFVFEIGVIVATTTDNIPAWKSSTLPLLVARLEPTDDADLTALSVPSTAWKMLATSHNMTLAETAGSWTLGAFSDNKRPTLTTSNAIRRRFPRKPRYAPAPPEP